MVFRIVGRISKAVHRSGCPVSISLETLGDRWSLLIIRDMMVRGHRSFKEFQQSSERIASNVLANRLHKLQAAGIITAEKEQTDARRINYRLTEKGIDLAPMLLELLIWGARHEDSGLPNAWVMEVAKRRTEFLAEVRKRWAEDDSTPLIPSFTNTKRSLARTDGSPWEPRQRTRSNGRRALSRGTFK